MSTKVVLTIDVEDLSATTFGDLYELGVGKFEGLKGLETCFQSIAGGSNSGSVEANVGAALSDGYVRVATGGSSAAQTFSVGNVTFTAVASSPSTNQFVVSATAATQAENMKNAINAATALSGVVVATRSGGDVIVTAVVPGAGGNAIQLSAGNLSNVTLPKAMSGGSDGTTYSL